MNVVIKFMKFIYLLTVSLSVIFDNKYSKSISFISTPAFLSFSSNLESNLSSAM